MSAEEMDHDIKMMHLTNGIQLVIEELFEKTDALGRSIYRIGDLIADVEDVGKLKFEQERALVDLFNGPKHKDIKRALVLEKLPEFIALPATTPEEAKIKYFIVMGMAFERMFK